ncbi:hypothetical protein PFICI_10384 [Pestalotiopsis fici W106-1]|uniref:Uncharacterized protein n=1 Tax=Pestalotiopsis fici (strain W106-1 / CGMCC3.15140) TaxID=1229662 RepID=W3WYY9_PESFW|nr:uncharacterized protein PFICI_10384 [Pestalotiopsis fici W106-1]ETS78322.1 hypothetical protein PFICI_10384 [Pestalotiopsis fici W106-1]
MPTREVETRLVKVTTDIRMSLKSPSPALNQDSGEFRKQTKDTKQDIQWMAKSKRKWKKCKSPPPEQQQEEERILQDQRNYQKEIAEWKGREFLLDFLQSHFPEHLDNITLRGTPTLEEIRMIGNEDLATGVRQCRRLFNAPVISDTVGSLLYQELRQGHALDHTHEVQYEEEAESNEDGGSSIYMPPGVVRRQKTCGFDQPMVTDTAHRDVYFNGEIGGLLADSLQAPAPSLRRANTTDLSETMARTTSPTARGWSSMSLAKDRRAASIPMQKKAFDGFVKDIKKSARKSATSFAASLASGYS